MRTTNKDLMLICKGHYDDKKYCNSTLSAVKSYIANYTGMEPEQIDNYVINNFLGKAVIKFAEKETIISSINNYASRNYDSHTSPELFLCFSYIGLLENIDIEGIDLSDYKLVLKGKENLI